MAVHVLKAINMYVTVVIIIEAPFFLALGCQPQYLVSNKPLNASLANGSLSIDGGQVQYSQTGAVSVAVYQCNPGYTLSGNVYRLCQNDGNWTGSVPHCDRIPSKYS